jgi:hypothetical protein
MHFPRKRRLALSAVLAAVAVSVTFAAPAFASEPGEWGSWTAETVNNHSMQVASQGTVNEARNDGNLLEVWRGATNNIVWMSLNNGDAFQIGTTETYVSPTVVPWGSDSFMVFHTGVDQNIYYTVVYGDGGYEGQWFAVPNQATNMPVSVTQMGPGSNNVYMVYRGVSSNQIWGTMFNSDDGEWQDTQNIGGGQSNSAPSVAWNNLTGQLNVVVRGLDNQVWMIFGGTDNWSAWYNEGGYTIDTPNIAASPSGQTMFVDYLDPNYNVYYRLYDEWGDTVGDWLQDTTGWQSHYPVALEAIGNAMVAVLTGLDYLAWFKQAYYNYN